MKNFSALRKKIQAEEAVRVRALKCARKAKALQKQANEMQATNRVAMIDAARQTIAECDERIKRAQLAKAEAEAIIAKYAPAPAEADPESNDASSPIDIIDEAVKKFENIVGDVPMDDDDEDKDDE